MENTMQDKNTTSVYNENIVQEIMELIDEYRKYGATQDLYTVESKLRELVENKFSVQKPLSDEKVLSLDCIYIDTDADGENFEVPTSAVLRFARNIELAHGIKRK